MSLDLPTYLPKKSDVICECSLMRFESHFWPEGVKHFLLTLLFYWTKNGFLWWWTTQVFSKVMTNHKTEMQWSQYGYQLYSKAWSKQLLKLFWCIFPWQSLPNIEDFLGWCYSCIYCGVWKVICIWIRISLQ